MRPLLAGVALVSAASLILQVVLTRIFSIAQWYHFAFIAVGLGLLGYGASGTALAVSARARRRPMRTAAWSALLVLPSIGIALLAVAWIPFDAYLMALEPRQSSYLAALVTALVLPFLCCGLGIGAALAAFPGRAGGIYAASFVGGAVGAICAVLLLNVLPAEGSLVAAASVAAVGAALLWWNHDRRASSIAGLLALLAAVGVSATPQIRASPYKALNQILRHPGARVEFSASNAISKVDVVRSAALRSAPGLSHTFPDVPPVLPGLTIDGESLRGLPATGNDAFTDYLPTAVAYHLQGNRGGRALVMGIGVEALGARRRSRAVTVIEGNPLVVRAAQAFAANVIGTRDVAPGQRPEMPVARLITENPRTFLRRTSERFDVIQVPPLESFQVVASGTFSLSEHYLYTVEAFRDYLNLLAPGGVLAVTRWIQTPPSEEIRVWAAAVAAAEALGWRRAAGTVGRAATASQLIALRTLSTMTVLVKPAGFSPEDVLQVRSFAALRRFDITFAPGADDSESNRFNVLPVDLHRQAFLAILDPARRENFLRAYPFDVRPILDRRPFFFHFFRWRQVSHVLATLGQTWQPFGGGGYLVLIVLLVIVTVLSAALILVPLRGLGGTTAPPRTEPSTVRSTPAGSSFPVPSRAAVFAYFLALGLAYLFVEIPLLQQMILVLGSPTYALAAVLCGLLLASGTGSLLAWRVNRGLPGLALALAAAALTGAWLLPRILDAALGLSLPGRVLVLGAIVAPLGILMGIPFPAALRALGVTAPSLIPWSWGINGCASVFGSIAATLIALEWGFQAVLIAGSLAYATAGIAARLGGWNRHVA